MAESMVFKAPSADQKRLIKALLKKAENLTLPINWLETVEVSLASDGGMGSMVLRSNLCDGSHTRFGSEASELQFRDVDGVSVLVTLYLDKSGFPFEVDVFKSDFSALIAIPPKL